MKRLDWITWGLASAVIIATAVAIFVVEDDPPDAMIEFLGDNIYISMERVPADRVNSVIRLAEAVGYSCAIKLPAYERFGDVWECRAPIDRVELPSGRSL